MFSSRQISMNGITLDADKPDSPEIKFFKDKGATVTIADGKISVTGSYSISGEEANAFLKEQAEKNKPKDTKETKDKAEHDGEAEGEPGEDADADHEDADAHHDDDEEEVAEHKEEAKVELSSSSSSSSASFLSAYARQQEEDRAKRALEEARLLVSRSQNQKRGK